MTSEYRHVVLRLNKGDSELDARMENKYEYLLNDFYNWIEIIEYETGIILEEKIESDYDLEFDATDAGFLYYYNLELLIGQLVG